MSNHFIAANLKSPCDDTRLDLTDLFVFCRPRQPRQDRSDHRRQPVHDRHGVPSGLLMSINTIFSGSQE
jgi:hypothetical protein